MDPDWDEPDFGNARNCLVKAVRQEKYNYKLFQTKLENLGFEVIGEGSFGVILASYDCVIKLIKDISRCKELAKEKTIYEALANRADDMLRFEARVPRYHTFELLDKFCHFNMERIYSPFSGYGEMEDGDGDFGHGYVVGRASEETLLFKEEGKSPNEILNEAVYLIGRPGKLIHFYVNHKIDPYLNEKLDNNQGMLLGQKTLEETFGKDLVRNFTYQIGQLLSYLILHVKIVPTDIEVVIGSRGVNDRMLRPVILDFNECTLYTKFDPRLIAGAMRFKNGKNYFPDAGSEYYEYFRAGFIDGAGNLSSLAVAILSEYK